MKIRSMMLLAVALMVFAACGGDSDDGGDAEAGSGGGGAVISIQDFAFSELTVEAGATISIENLDEAPHTVSSLDGSFGSGQVDAGSTGEIVAPSEPGEYAYICNIHPTMEGTLVVS